MRLSTLNFRAKIGVPLALVAAAVVAFSFADATGASKHTVEFRLDPAPASTPKDQPTFKGWVVPVPGVYQAKIAAAAKKNGIPANLLAAVLYGESRWDPHSVGDGGTSFGLAQIHLVDHPWVKKSDALNPDFAIQWEAQWLALRWDATSGNIVATVLQNNCPVCAAYYADAKQYGPSPTLAAKANDYVTHVLAPIGGMRAAPRLKQKVAPK